MDLPSPLVKVVHFHALLLATVLYCVIAVRPRSPGWPRLLAGIPAFVFFSLSPLLVQESVVLSGCVGLTLMWVANFKLLAYSGGRGALAHPAVGPGWRWGALLVLPFFPAKAGRAPAALSSHLALAAVALKLAAWLALSVLLLAPPTWLTPACRHVCYAVFMWLFVALCLEAASPLGGALMSGVPLQPAMDAPYAAISVREFWGQRYNQIVSATLLETVYKPIVQRRWVAVHATPAPAAEEADGAREDVAVVTSVSAGPGVNMGGSLRVRAGGPPLAATPVAPAEALGTAPAPHHRCPSVACRLAGMGVSFLVSGIMHEICVMYMCGGSLEGSFRMLSFFVVQPLLIAAQDAFTSVLLPAAWRDRTSVRVLQVMATLALVLSSAELFWAPLETCKIDQRGLEEVVGLMQTLAQQVRMVGIIPLAAAG